ncbi:nucleotide sugar dehydrogenase [Tatlockia micdadei]|uniref:nucleotide sugar dehydrogenase n=1 Tax=Legionella micdadei TaxID=451 RepID=UPI00157149A4|nr:nucleotide sugar dehydrogenase [Legionella micdadei]NSL19242.1 nucleotide sugar dehydrogenase [Legionella micdadei]
MRKIAVIGLGYVGLGLAQSLGKHNPVLGYDISKSRISELKNNVDRNHLFTKEELSESNIEYVTDLQAIKHADFYIVSVSTPAYYYELPNLEPLIKATKQLATILKKGDVVVFESTVYPGTTEEVCQPLLEEISGLKSPEDFSIGYSPERINPNDLQHTLANTPKIISAQNKESLKIIEEVYKTCCQTTYPVSNIMAAEAVKILENTQRDVNIAFMNEFSEIMHALNLNVHEIIEAAKTKWNFVPFKPGFVGGHCISVDSLYLAFKAKRVDVQHDLILTARKVNDGITRFVKHELIKILIKNRITVPDCPIGIFGLTYKENIPDIRNSLALKFIKELNETKVNYFIHDPLVDKNYVFDKYHIQIQEFEEIKDISVAIIIVAHDFYREAGIERFLTKMGSKKIIMDIPNLFADSTKNYDNIQYWSL